MEAVLWSTEIVFFNKSFILASGNDFWLITDLLLLFRAFFFLVDTILEIKCKPIFKEEHYSCLLKPFSWICRYSSKRKQLFQANGNEVFVKSFITTSVYGFWVNFKPCAFIQGFFSAAGKHY